MLGIIDGDTGRVGRAIAHLRRGVALAEVAHLDDRKVDLAASLATAYALAGQRSAMHRVFDEALRVTHGVAKARILVRRGGVLVMLGDHHGAYRDCTQAAELLHRARDPIWEAHARTNTACALLMLGRFEEADEQYELAQELSEGLGEEYAATITLHSRGDCAHRKGDLPRALRLLYQARDRYQELGLVPPEVVRDLAVVLAAAELTDEATTAADELVEVLEADRASAGRRADGLITAAIVHLDYGNAKRAIELARRAVRANHRQDNVEGERHSKLVLLRAQAATGRVTKRHAVAAADLASVLKDRHAAERLEAQLLAGRVARQVGLTELATQQFQAASASGGRDLPSGDPPRGWPPRSWPTCAGIAPACCEPTSGASPCWTPTLSRSAPPNCGPGQPRTASD
jgi:tetratricopeptide (TPR) repeat protein